MFRFPENYQERLQQLLDLALRGGHADDGQAGRARGGRLEFREHRPYVAGDDLRDVDWNLWARLDALSTKEYERSDRPPLFVILDRSGSLGGEGSPKDRVQRELAGALIYLALRAGGQATIAMLTEGGPVTLGSFRSHRRWESVVKVLLELGTPGGPTWLRGLQHLAPPSPEGRHGFLISDFLTAEVPVAGFVALSRGGAPSCLVRLYDENDRRVPLDGPGTLEDPETGARLAVDDPGELLEAWPSILAAHDLALRSAAARHRLGFVDASSDAPFEEAMQKILWSAGAPA